MKNFGFPLLLLGLLFFLACDSNRELVNDDEATMGEATPTAVENEVPQRKSIAEATPLDVSQYLIEDLAVRKDISALRTNLAGLNAQTLAAQLNTKEKKLAFWINVYNAAVNQTLSERPELWNDRRAFFSMPIITVAGKELSLEDIEHGIIRGSETKLGMGYVDKLFPGEFEKMMRVDETDPRIHFALNCGAKDCPPVYTFNAATIDADLDRLTRAYLDRFSRYIPEENKVYTTPLLKWFKGDFRAYDGVDDFLKAFGIVPEEAKDPDPEYIEYDWTMDLNNFG